jgi:hypothetical protein
MELSRDDHKISQNRHGDIQSQSLRCAIWQLDSAQERPR